MMTWEPPYTDAEVLALFRLSRWAFATNDRLALNWIATHSVAMRAAIASARTN